MDRERSRATGFGARLIADLFPVREVEERREALLLGQRVSYRLHRSARRKRITLQVDETGLRVNAPWLARQQDVDFALQSLAHWALPKIEVWAQRPRPESVQWASGARLHYLGAPVTLAVNPSRLLAPTTLHEDGTLAVGVPPGADARVVRAAVITWYRQQARAHLPGRVHHFAATLGLPHPRVMIADARRRWGSCNARREVRLNWRLMLAARHLVDYVAAHEVAHLIHLNHSPDFWYVVEDLYPDWRKARRELGEVGRQYLNL